MDVLEIVLIITGVAFGCVKHLIIERLLIFPANYRVPEEGQLKGFSKKGQLIRQVEKMVVSEFLKLTQELHLVHLDDVPIDEGSILQNVSSQRILLDNTMNVICWVAGELFPSMHAHQQSLLQVLPFKVNIGEISFVVSHVIYY